MQYLKSIIKPCTLFFLLSFVTLFCGLSQASEKQHFSLAHIDQGIDLDGQLNEPHWQQATLVPLRYQNEPNEKGTPQVKTDAYIYADGN